MHAPSTPNTGCSVCFPRPASYKLTQSRSPTAYSCSKLSVKTMPSSCSVPSVQETSHLPMSDWKESQQVQLDERCMVLGLLLLGESVVKHNLTSLQGKEPIIWQLYAAHFSGRLVVKGNKIYADISTRRFPLEATFTAVSWIFSETAWEDLFCVSIFLGNGADNGHT